MSAFLVIVLGATGTAEADFTFGEPVLFDEPVNSSGPEYFECISADGLELYVERTFEVAFPALDWDLYVSTRETADDPWSVPVSLGPTVNSDYTDYTACLSGDGLELYFASNRPDGHGSYDIWVATRPTRSDPWATLENLGPPINTPDKDSTPWITPDGLELYFSSDRPGGHGFYDIWVATRSRTSDTWDEPVNLGSVVNSPASEHCPCLSSDGLVLFFCDNEWLSELRPGGQGLSDMWVTRRKSHTDLWEPPVGLGRGMNTNCWDTQPRISPDGSVLYFTSSRPDSRVLAPIRDIWQAPVIPIVDLNGDGQVDGKDLLVMIVELGDTDALCDIGPCAWGDGVVDPQDLIVLAEHIGTHVNDRTLIAHWALDEMEGDIAHDSAGDNEGTVLGHPVWNPESGAVNGALSFDGVDDHVVTDHVLDPADRPFSVLAWIQGGAPGQAIVSQANGVNWLLVDPSEGTLASELEPPLRRFAVPPLVSDCIIADGIWHRVAFVWDGASRSLYVDGTLVAQDEQDNLAESRGDMHIGCGTDLEPSTFFSGLIDDVRIYNRAVKP